MNQPLRAKAILFDLDGVLALEDPRDFIFIKDAAATGTLDLTRAQGIFVGRWYNPRTGRFEGPETRVHGGGHVSLGPSPVRAIEPGWLGLPIGSGLLTATV